MRVFLVLVAASLALACENQCDRRNIGWLPHDTDCGRYFLCHHGNQIERSCAPNLHFNNEVGLCMSPAFAHCQRRCPEHDDPANPVFLPNDQDCRNFSICYNGVAIERECASGLVFDTEHNWCDFPWNVDCGHRPSPGVPTPTPPPPTPTPGTESTPTFGPDDDNTRTPLTTRNPDSFDCALELGPSFHPHTIHCHRYFKCYRGIAYLEECPDGREFDQFELRCMLDANCFARNPPPPSEEEFAEF